jgi:hypothetical protein
MKRHKRVDSSGRGWREKAQTSNSKYENTNKLEKRLN